MDSSEVNEALMIAHCLLPLRLTGFHDHFIQELDIFNAIFWMGIIAIIEGCKENN